MADPISLSIAGAAAAGATAFGVKKSLSEANKEPETPDLPGRPQIPTANDLQNEISAEDLAEQRRAINARRRGRQQLRIDPAIQASGQQRTTGLFIPR
jgi:hypothetical protein